MTFKKWVIPLLLAALMTAANIIYWFMFGNGEHTLAIWLNILPLVLLLVVALSQVSENNAGQRKNAS